MEQGSNVAKLLPRKARKGGGKAQESVKKKKAQRKKDLTPRR